MLLLKKPAYQWDIGKKIEIVEKDGEIIEFVHFARFCDKDATIVEVKVVDGQKTAEIPNEFLQTIHNISAYAVSNKKTVYRLSIDVNPRKKPADYVYTPTEIKSYDDLLERIEALEESGGGTGGGGGSGFSPIAKVEQTTYGAIITITDKNGTTTARITNGIDGKDGVDGINGKDGQDGYTPIKGTDYWTEADKQEIVSDVLSALPKWEGGSY